MTIKHREWQIEIPKHLGVSYGLQDGEEVDTYIILLLIEQLLTETRNEYARVDILQTLINSLS